MGVTNLPDFSSSAVIPSIAPTFLKFDFAGLFTAKAGIIVVIMTIFTLVISDLFDTIGTFIGTGRKAKIFEVSEEGELSPNFERALFADSIGTIVASMLGCSNVSTYMESSAGIEAGGRTGLTSLFAAVFFLLSLFIAPIVAIVPAAATAPVLILMGVSMIENIGNINWSDILIAIPAFFIITMMPFAFSITIGIEIGFMFYALIYAFNGKGKKVSPIIYVLSLMFIIDFVYKAIG